jgi:anti-anti-sigma factor
VSPAVAVVVRETPGCTVVSPQGRLYFDTVRPLRDALLLIAAGERARVVLDLSDVAMCDSSGLSLMAQAHLLATRQGGWLRLAGVHPDVRRVLEATNLTRILPIYDTVEAAAR